jgi:hypothetical protein
MNYIISEDRVNDLILKYIENTYPVDEINYTEYEDEDGNPNDSAYVFYYGDWDNGDEVIFRWYGKNYFQGDDELSRLRVSQSPMLYFEDSREIDKLHSLFGNKWEPVFINWFYRNFNLRIKNVI